MPNDSDWTPEMKAEFQQTVTFAQFEDIFDAEGKRANNFADPYRQGFLDGLIAVQARLDNIRRQRRRRAAE